MRRITSEQNPCIVGLNDQSYVIDWLIGNLCKIAWLDRTIKNSVIVSSYVRNRQYVLGNFREEIQR